MKKALLFALSSITSAAQAGWYAAPHVKWGAFAPRPQTDEATYNYYGYGLGMAGGYSIAQKLDLGLFGSYLPANRHTAKIADPHAEFSFYGGELALRLGEGVYLALRRGASQYNAAARSNRAAEELIGVWRGQGAGVALGGIVKLSRENYLQTSLELMHTSIRSQRDPSQQERQLDAFAITFGYTFNDFQSTLLQNTAIGEFISNSGF